ncbi:hypothetical protein OPV22_004832 [Ensete ventricosum]|uniref:Uncharacterized protein n=1 Tax=Ensete ventricosum TaxID=4639 RepID=A0AAV8RH42_ENSVE|nr:hypothetical protein OPV22_004832 [Ensete ventricosum]
MVLLLTGDREEQPSISYVLLRKERQILHCSVRAKCIYLHMGFKLGDYMNLTTWFGNNTFHIICNEHAATVVGSKMVVVGGDSSHNLLDDTQILSLDSLTWAPVTSKIYSSPGTISLNIPACKGHTLVSWGKSALLVGGKTDPLSDKLSGSVSLTFDYLILAANMGNTPVARGGHTALRAGAVLILFGGEDVKGRKLNDLFMFDLKSLTWLPLHYKGRGPSARSNHVAALYEDKLLFIFGGQSKSRILNDLHSIDFETMIWTRVKNVHMHLCLHIEHPDGLSSISEP